MSHRHAARRPAAALLSALLLAACGGGGGGAGPTTGTPPAAPAISGVDPSTGSPAGGALITITGRGFSASPAVTFGGAPAAVVTSSPTVLTVAAPPHAAGLVEVTVTNADGQAATRPAAFAFSAPGGAGPSIASVLNDATSLPAGSIAGGEAVTITGDGFFPGATVHFGAAPAGGVTWISLTTLQAVTPLAQPPGAVDVTVSLPGTGLSATLAHGFAFQAPAPAVAAFNVRGSPAAGGGVLLIRGAHLDPGATVRFGAAPAEVLSYTPGIPPDLDSLTVAIPASPLLPDVEDGFVDVVLTNPDGQSSTLGPRFGRDGTPWPGNFHYGPPPVATGFSPGTGKGLDVTVTGVGFSADATGPRSGLQVNFEGHSFAVTPIRICPDAADPACPTGAVSPSAGAVIVTLPSKQLNPGNYVFVVTNFDGQSSVAPGAFVVP